MLFPSELRQFTPTRHQLVLHCLKTLKERLTLSRQLLTVVRLCQQRVQILIQLIVPVITRAMTGIVADIKRFVTIRRLRQRHILKLVRTVVAVSLLRARLQYVVHIDSLGSCADRQES